MLWRLRIKAEKHQASEGVFIISMALRSILMQVERQRSAVNSSHLSPHHPSTVYSCNLQHVRLSPQFLHKQHLRRLCFLSVSSTRGKTALLCSECSCQPTYVSSFYLFLEEVVICRELLFSWKSNFMQLVRMRFCVCMCWNIGLLWMQVLSLFFLE